MTYEVQVSYKDSAGHSYSEPAVLDLNMCVGTGGVTRHDIHDIHKLLKEITTAIKRWTDFGGLKVLTRRDVKKRQEERDAAYAEREREMSSTPED